MVSELRRFKFARSTFEAWALSGDALGFWRSTTELSFSRYDEEWSGVLESGGPLATEATGSRM
jgi:hypothetical protein